jgi:autotransporter-associated beta strand protein
MFLWRSSLRLTFALLCLTSITSSFGQTIRFRSGQVRVTVPINSTNSTIITNQVNLTGVTNASFDVSGLPAGASAFLTDTNSNPVVNVTTDTNLWLVVNTTNIAEGVYTFSLNANGLDTNGAPVTNYVLYVLQAAHIWNGSLNVSNNWATAPNWLGGVPTATSDIVFGDTGAQTNYGANGLAFTNIGIDVDTTVASIRFTQTGLTNAAATDTNTPPRYHTIRIAAGKTLSVTGTNGFSLLRDYVDDIQGLGSMTVQISGGAGAKLVVSNAAANFGVLLGNQAQPTLNISNIDNCSMYVSRLGLAEYQLFPNYRNYNDLNQFNDDPRRFIANIFLPRTNVITAIWKDPDNYNNEFTRTYAMSYQDSEVSGVGSSVNNIFYFGQSNAFFMDSVCFIRANHATGNGGAFRFNTNYANPTALFRGTNGSGRMSVFTVSDDGGTNYANSNVKGTIDFASGNGQVDVLVDRLYVSRDRTLIASNQTPNVQGDLFIGKGTVDANTMILGYQEHNGKTNWTDLYGAAPYLNYCQGRLFVTNGGTVKVNGTLTLGFTADSNSEGAAQQYNTLGQITVYSNSTVMASNIVADGGLNFVSVSQPRRNDITLNQGATLIVTNSIGAAPGLKLDDLVMTTATLTMQNVDPGRTNVYVKNLRNPGSIPTTIKILTLTGVSSFPAQIPLISYEVSAPFMVADVSALGASFKGYILDNQANKTIDVFITTNAPNNLIWRGNTSSDWDTTTKNWITAVGSIQTNFSIGDSVTFDDSSTVNNVNIVSSVVPGQSGTGVTVNNTTRDYTFSGSGTVAGTSLLVKQGTGNLTISATKQGPVTINAGAVLGNGSIGVATVASNATLNFSGLVNGGLTSTGTVSIASGGTVFGPVALGGGSLSNSGTVSNTTPALTITGTTRITNSASGTMYLGGGNYTLNFGSTLANFGTIYNLAGRIQVANAAAPFDGGFFFGTGTMLDPDGGLVTGIDGRVAINPSAVLSPGASPSNSIGTMTLGARVDLNNIQGGGLGQLLIEVDFSNPQTNDIVGADKWNNITGMIIMTNINPGAGSFASGQVFQVFSNTSGLFFPNSIDVNGTYPVMWPPLPVAGLQWGLADFRTYGRISVTNTPLVWNGNVNGNWDTNTANWQSGNIYSDNQGAMLDDSALGTTTITLTNVIAPIGFILTTNIVPNVSTNIFTNNPIMSPGLVISNTAKNYSISGSGRISGMTGLYKVGTGTLSLFTSNDFTGSPIIAGGTLAISNAFSLGLNGSGGINNEVFIDGATLRYMGTNANLARAPFFATAGATIEVFSGTNDLTLNTAAVGPGSLTKTGPGTLVLSQAADNYAGGTTLSAGGLRLTAAALGTGPFTLGSSTTVTMTNGFTFTNTVNVASSGVTILLGNNTNVSSGTWSGNGSVTVGGTNVGQLILNASISSFGGTISLGTSANSIRFNNSTNSNPNSGSTAANFDLGTGSGNLYNLNGNGLTYNLGSLSGGANTVLFGSGTNMGVPASTYSIGANGSNTVFSGRITNGVGAVTIVKTGSGKLTVGGNNTYTGGTTISGGTLLVNNTGGSGTGSGAVSVSAGATLGGTGAIAGPVSVSGTLAPGASIGTLAISNSLVLAGVTSVEVSKSGATLTSDKVIGLTSVSFGGSLMVSNVGPDALAGGNTFQLFNIGGSGNFTNITPALANPLVWSFNPANGVLSVIDTRPVLGVTPVGGGNSLQFTWSGSFKLQAQTNSLLGTWQDYPGGNVSGVTVAIDRTQTDVFFRLVQAP